jgi:CcmD family protein
MQTAAISSAAPTTVPGPAPSNAAPSDRAATFQAVEGGGEHTPGGPLLVSAYALIWVLLFGWLVTIWRKQNAISARIAELDKILDAKAAGATAKSS